MLCAPERYDLRPAQEVWPASRSTTLNNQARSAGDNDNKRTHSARFKAAARPLFTIEDFRLQTKCLQLIQKRHTLWRER